MNFSKICYFDVNQISAFKYKQSLKESTFNSLKDQVKFFTAKDPVNGLITNRKLKITIVRFLNY